MGAILLLILLLLAVLLDYGAFGTRWRGVVRRAMGPAMLLGGIGFAVGFVGPIIFLPDANQGPLLGIFITGPGGFLIGLIYGVVRELHRPSSSHPAA